MYVFDSIRYIYIYSNHNKISRLDWQMIMMFVCLSVPLTLNR